MSVCLYDKAPLNADGEMIPGIMIPESTVVSLSLVQATFPPDSIIWHKVGISWTLLYVSKKTIQINIGRQATIKSYRC